MKYLHTMVRVTDSTPRCSSTATRSGSWSCRAATTRRAASRWCSSPRPATSRRRSSSPTTGTRKATAAAATSATSPTRWTTSTPPASASPSTASTINSAAARRAHGLRALARQHLDRAAAERRGAGAGRAVEVDAQHRQLVTRWRGPREAPGHRDHDRATLMTVGAATGHNGHPVVDSWKMSLANKRKSTMSNADVRGRFVWHELMTTDTAAAAAFYPKVVPWRTHPSSMPGYTIWMAGQTQVGGLMALPPDAAGTPPHWLVYIGTPQRRCHRARRRSASARASGRPPPTFPTSAASPCWPIRRARPSRSSRPPEPRPAPRRPARGGFSWHELRDHRRRGRAALLRRAVRLAQGARPRHGRDGHLPALRARRHASRRHVQRAGSLDAAFVAELCAGRGLAACGGCCQGRRRSR